MEGMEHDPNIRVDVTDITDDLTQPFCIRVLVGGVEADMHFRSAIDLHHKLGLALSDWISVQAAAIVKEAIAKRENP